MEIYQEMYGNLSGNLGMVMVRPEFAVLCSNILKVFFLFFFSGNIFFLNSLTAVL